MSSDLPPTLLKENYGLHQEIGTNRQAPYGASERLSSGDRSDEDIQ